MRAACRPSGAWRPTTWRRSSRPCGAPSWTTCGYWAPRRARTPSMTLPAGPTPSSAAGRPM
eukprot:1053469-Lingulodinium_polyedra.AAC.1